MFRVYFILFPVLYSSGVVSLEIDGTINLGPKWNYEYSIKHFTTPQPQDTTSTNSNAQRTPDESKSQIQEHKLIDIIIKNNNSGSDNDKTTDKFVNKTKHKKRHSVKKNDKEVSSTKIYDRFTVLEVFTGKPERSHTSKKHKHFSQDHTNPEPKKHKLKKRGTKADNVVSISEQPLDSGVSVNGEFAGTLRRKKQKKKIRSGSRKNKSQDTLDSNENNTEATRSIIVENFPKRVTSLVDTAKYKSMYIEPQLVKDDPKIKEFTRHVYEQSIKVFESIKKKMTNYNMRKEVDHLMKSYEDKFGDFVRETQNQQIKTRLGRQKVILNTVDTSNRILERLVNYLIGKMDYKGVLRNEGAENVLQNEIHKKMELENKHICSKLQICRSQESFSKFMTEILNVILKSDDRKVTEAKDAITEVLKDTDFSHAINADTEKRFLKGVNDLEKYDAFIMRPVFFIMKNIVANKNAPIKVVGPEDSRVNKTIAFLDIIDSWEKKLPPNENNLLEWNDMQNSFRDWSEGTRRDIKDLMQSFTEHLLKVINSYDNDEAKNFDRNINIILGY